MWRLAGRLAAWLPPPRPLPRAAPGFESTWRVLGAIQHPKSHHAPIVYPGCNTNEVWEDLEAGWLAGWLPSSVCGHFLWIYYSKLMQHPLAAASLLLWLFLMQLLLEIDAKSCLGCLPAPAVICYVISFQNGRKILSSCPASSCGHFLCNSYAELMQNPLWMPCLLFKYYSELMQKPLVAASLLLW